MPELTLASLVRNRTLSPEMAATLAAAAEERRSLLFVAIPQMAGKSTLMQTVLEYTPAETPMHHLSCAVDPTLGIPPTGDGGYLIVGEVSPAGYANYFWDEDVRQVFASLDRGFSMATALHAGSVNEACDVLTRENGVPATEAARLDVVVYLRMLGDDWSNPTRRVAAAIAETDGVRPRQARVLHRWSEADDCFEVGEPSERIAAATIERYLRVFAE